MDGARFRFIVRNGGFRIGRESLSPEELLRRIEAAPENFNANVLLRPVLQDYWLPTLAYIGGPAEIAYFAQVGVVYEKLLGRITPVVSAPERDADRAAHRAAAEQVSGASCRNCFTANTSCAIAWRRARFRRS